MKLEKLIFSQTELSYPIRRWTSLNGSVNKPSEAWSLSLTSVRTLDGSRRQRLRKGDAGMMRIKTATKTTLPRKRKRLQCFSLQPLVFLGGGDEDRTHDLSVANASVCLFYSFPTHSYPLPLSLIVLNLRLTAARSEE